MLTSSENAEAIVSSFESELKTSSDSFDDDNSFAAHINLIVAKLKEIKTQLEAYDLFNMFRFETRLYKCLNEYVFRLYSDDIKCFLTRFRIITEQLKNNNLFDSLKYVLKIYLIDYIYRKLDRLRAIDIRCMNHDELRNENLALINMIASLEKDQNVAEFVENIKVNLDCFKLIITIIEKFLEGKNPTEIRSLVIILGSQTEIKIEIDQNSFYAIVGIVDIFFQELNAADLLQEAESIGENPSEDDLQSLINKILAAKTGLGNIRIFALQTVEKLNRTEGRLRNAIGTKIMEEFKIKMWPEEQRGDQSLFSIYIDCVIRKFKEAKDRLEANGLFDKFKRQLMGRLEKHICDPKLLSFDDIQDFLINFGILINQFKRNGLFDSFKVILARCLIFYINTQLDNLKTAIKTMDRSKLEDFKATVLNIAVSLNGYPNVAEFVGLIRGELDCFKSIINIVEKFLSGDTTDIRSLLTDELSDELVEKTNVPFNVNVQAITFIFYAELRAAKLLQEAESIIAAKEKPSEEELQTLSARILAAKHALGNGCIFALQTVEKLNGVEKKLGISKDTITQEQPGPSETNSPEIKLAATNVVEDDQALQRNKKKMKIAIALQVIFIAASIFFGLAIINLQFNFVTMSYMFSNKLMLEIFSTACGVLAVAAISIGVYIYSIVKLNRQINSANTKKAVIDGGGVVADRSNGDLLEDQAGKEQPINY